MVALALIPLIIDNVLYERWKYANKKKYTLWKNKNYFVKKYISKSTKCSVSKNKNTHHKISH